MAGYSFDDQSRGSSNRSAGVRVASLVLMCPSVAMLCVCQGSAAVSRLNRYLFLAHKLT
jgi:hypothetical protein